MIRNESYHGERPLYGLKKDTVDTVKIMDGESAFKECENLTVTNSEFHGKYPFWHDRDIRIKNGYFSEGGRAAVWYSHGIELVDSVVEAPKIFRDATDIHIVDTKFDTDETLWDCHNVRVRNASFTGNYLLLHSEELDVDGMTLDGNYSFQHVRSAVFRNSRIRSKDAFWNTKNVTVYDSVIEGEYLGWYSENLKLVRCKVIGTQPLCYARGLVMEDCEIIQGDLCFEHSDVTATLKGSVDSIKNPSRAMITADAFGELILDEVTSESDVIMVERSAMVKEECLAAV